jgi:protein SCO1
MTTGSAGDAGSRRTLAFIVRIGVLAVVLFFVFEALMLWIERDDHARREPTTAAPTAPRGGGAPLPVLWSVPEFQFLDQNGHPFASSALSGRVWIADFIYTRCTSVCPVLSAKMVQLQRRLSSSSLRFVSFSIDPAHDTPEVLRSYAARWHADEARWILLRTTETGVRTLASAVRLSVGEDETGEPLHAARFLLVDGAGQVRGVYSGEAADGLEALERDARALMADVGAQASFATPEVKADRGQALYQQLGCDGCHATAAIAPPLGGIWGRQVHLAGGETVVADAEYLEESILEPGRRLVQGYPPIMPSYRRQLDDQDLAALVDWLRRRPADTSGSSPLVSTSTADPVCGMQVHVGPETPSARAGDRTWYFCSDSCRDRFRADPGRWLAHVRAER